MGSAVSSALRVDESAYGSLEGLGGGMRPLKKKPVLVLDPDELAAAHAAFHEASAEILGETVERAPQPAMILGLAPMDDDDAGDMGQADDIGEDADTGQPSPEAVLSLTRRSSTPMINDYADDCGTPGFAEKDFGAFDSIEREEPEPREIGMGPIERLSTIEDGLDIANRIFPSLAISQGVYHEPEDTAPPPPPAALHEQAAPAPAPTPKSQPPVRPAQSTVQAASPVATPAPTAQAQPVAPAAPATPPAQRSALNALASRIADRTAQPPAAPVPPVAVAPAATPVQPVPAKPIPAEPAPVRFEEHNPAKDYDLPEEVYDLDHWLAADDDSEADAQRTFATPEPVASSTPAPPPEPVTFIAEDTVDGLAFMREAAPRRGVPAAAPRGQNSALRARLLREAEAEAATVRQEDAPQSKSLFVAMWKKLTAFLRR